MKYTSEQKDRISTFVTAHLIREARVVTGETVPEIPGASDILQLIHDTQNQVHMALLENTDVEYFTKRDQLDANFWDFLVHTLDEAHQNRLAFILGDKTADELLSETKLQKEIFHEDFVMEFLWS